MQRRGRERERGRREWGRVDGGRVQKGEGGGTQRGEKKMEWAEGEKKNSILLPSLPYHRPNGYTKE